MHPEAFAYVANAAHQLGLHDRHLTALEIGARNVNGSCRNIFPHTTFTGIDLHPGPNVDHVTDAAHYHGHARYQLVLCTETLEHAPNPAAVIHSARRALQTGGILITTMAGEGRNPHGIDGGPPGDEHYRNITADDLTQWLTDWDTIDITENPETHDLYATAQKPLDSYANSDNRRSPMLEAPPAPDPEPDPEPDNGDDE